MNSTTPASSAAPQVAASPRQMPQESPEASAPPASPIGPSAPCPCGSGEFWRDAFGVIRCAACKPAKVPAMVRSRLSLNPAGELIEKRPPPPLPANLPPPTICQHCGHTRFRFFGEKNFCDKCERKFFPSPADSGRLLVSAYAFGGRHWIDPASNQSPLVHDVLTDEERNFFDSLRLRKIRDAEQKAADASKPAGKKRGRRK